MTAIKEKTLAEKLKASNLTLAVAESCTGGLIGHTITNKGGSSAYFKGGIIAYNNDVKRDLLGVKAATLKNFGAVSKETAREMAEGIRLRLKADIGISVTGIAGPGGGSIKKPVGLVYIAISKRGKVKVIKEVFSGTRLTVKKATAKTALQAVRDFI